VEVGIKYPGLIPHYRVIVTFDKIAWKCANNGCCVAQEWRRRAAADFPVPIHLALNGDAAPTDQPR
jgi:hypothetical protein